MAENKNRLIIIFTTFVNGFMIQHKGNNDDDDDSNDTL